MQRGGLHRSPLLFFALCRALPKKITLQRYTIFFNRANDGALASPATLMKNFYLLSVKKTKQMNLSNLIDTLNIHYGIHTDHMQYVVTRFCQEQTEGVTEVRTTAPTCEPVVLA